MHQKSVKLADFGSSGKIVEPSSKVFSIIPYVNPKCIGTDQSQNENCKPNEKSDVYSIGMLMWQISSGRQPFNETDHDDVGLSLDISNGKREEIIDGTPIKYSNLYEGK